MRHSKKANVIRPTVSTVVLLYTMKLLRLVSVLLFHFFSKAFCLKCYECLNLYRVDGCKQPQVTTCGPESSQNFCEKFDYDRTNTYPFKYCNGNCTIKGCIPDFFDQLCEESTTSNLSKIQKGTGYCCEGDLCNCSNKMYNQNILFYSIVFVCTFDLVEYLFI